MKATDIIYKARRTDNGEWVQGYYISFTHEKTGGDSVESELGHFIFPFNQDESGIYREIHPETLCIGFKDETGKCWFAGDRVTIRGANQFGVVEFYINAGFSIKLDGGKTISIYHYHAFEVTGNIHD